jgi:4-hydroxy-2-oxoheptanedioate aldolase
MNSLRQAIDEGRPTFGGWIILPGSMGAEAMGSAGFDWVIADMQHGGITVHDLVPIFQGLGLGGTLPIVRVPWTDAPTIMRVLDFGAAGVIVPMVNTPEEAAIAASAVRYPPDGVRSFGRTRGPAATIAEANADVVLMVMIETTEALGNVDAIAATPGVDGLFVGPVDLGLSLGLPLDFTGSSPGVREAMDTIIAAARRAGRFVGTVSSSAEHAQNLVERGATFVSLGADAGYLRAGATKDRAAMDAIRAAVAESEATRVTGSAS